jgi:hypothetical protein
MQWETTSEAIFFQDTVEGNGKPPQNLAKQCSVTVNALELHAIDARFKPLACPSLMVPSGGETDVKLGF